MKHNIYINVYLANLGFTPAGVIIYDSKNHLCGFSYFPEYIQANHPPINPATLNWRKTNSPHFLFSNFEQFDRTFWELLPSTIDWSYQIILSRYPEYETMNMPEKLLFLKSRTVGGLQAHLEKEEDEQSIKGSDWLEKIYQESISFYLHDVDKIKYHHAFVPITTYGGLRPKCMFQDDSDDLWIAKFNVPDDEYNMAHIEQVCMHMAKDLDIPVAESSVLSLHEDIPSNDIFLSKRFDRKGEKRIHSLPFFALAENITKPSHDNTFSGNSPLIMQQILNYSDFQNKDTLLLVQKFIFDIAVNNTDNHLRNIRLLLNDNYLWEVAPLFDITMTPYISDFTYNPAALPTSELFLNNPHLAQRLSDLFNIDVQTIQAMIDKCQQVTGNYETYCSAVNMKEDDLIIVEQTLNIGKHKKNFAYRQKNENKLSLAPKLTPKFK